MGRGRRMIHLLGKNAIAYVAYRLAAHKLVAGPLAGMRIQGVVVKERSSC